jgi:hypothetical protein
MNVAQMKRPAIALAAGLLVLAAGLWVRRYADLDRSLHEELAPFAKP